MSLPEKIYVTYSHPLLKWNTIYMLSNLVVMTSNRKEPEYVEKRINSKWVHQEKIQIDSYASL